VLTRARRDVRRNIVLREVISTSSVDGKKFPDSLPALGTTTINREASSRARRFIGEHAG
jgi:hypothetical protein